MIPTKLLNIETVNDKLVHFIKIESLNLCANISSILKIKCIPHAMVTPTHSEDYEVLYMSNKSLTKLVDALKWSIDNIPDDIEQSLIDYHYDIIKSIEFAITVSNVNLKGIAVLIFSNNEDTEVDKVIVNLLKEDYFKINIEQLGEIYE